MQKRKQSKVEISSSYKLRSPKSNISSPGNDSSPGKASKKKLKGLKKVGEELDSLFNDDADKDVEESDDYPINSCCHCNESITTLLDNPTTICYHSGKILHVACSIKLTIRKKNYQICLTCARLNTYKDCLPSESSYDKDPVISTKSNMVILFLNYVS